MKNQEQVLLALLLLALTSMAAVAGGMNTREPFFEEHEDEDVPADGEMPMEGDMPVVDEGFAGNSPGAQMVSTDLEDVEKAEAEGFVQNAMPEMNANANDNAMPELPAADAVEGFTGSMYAGF